MTIFSLHGIWILWWFFSLFSSDDMQLKNKAWRKMNHKKHGLWEHDLLRESHYFPLLSLTWEFFFVGHTHCQIPSVIPRLVVLPFSWSAAETKLFQHPCDTCMVVPRGVTDWCTVYLGCVLTIVKLLFGVIQIICKSVKK